MFCCGPAFFDGGSAAPDPSDNIYYVELTIASGEVASDLTDFPVYVDLSDMPAAFWTHVQQDGGDIRVFATDGTTQIPMDLVRIDYDDETGSLFFKRTVASGSNTVVRIYYGATGLDPLPVTDTYGRNAVWADYEQVLLFGETPYDRTGGSDVVFTGTHRGLEVVATSPDLVGVHDGISTDGTYYYASGNNVIKKYDLTWAVVLTNSDPAGDTGIGGATQVGGHTYYNGKLYVSMGTQISVFNASDLTHVQNFDISAQASSIDGICYNADDGFLYVINYTPGDVLYKYDPADGSYEGSITLSTALPLAQGLGYWRSAFWISEDTGKKIYRVETTGAVAAGGVFAISDPNCEGLHPTPDGCGLLFLVIGLGSTPKVYTLQPLDLSLSAGGGRHQSSATASSNTAESAFSGALGASWTVGVSFQQDNDFTQRTIINVCPVGTTTGLVNITVDNGNSLGTWDSNNLWLYCNPAVNPNRTQMHRANITYDGTTSRSIFYNGGNKNTDNTITARSTLARFLQNDLKGWTGFLYARVGILSDSWIAAEYSNLSAPASFYSLGPEEPA